MDAKGSIMMCKLQGRMDKGGHYDAEIKGGCNRGQYNLPIKRANGERRAL